jgi:hypothetical protein
LQDITDDWNIDIWALDADGKKITANAKAKSVITSKDVLRIEYSDFKSPDYNQDINGTTVISYSPDNGFMIENQFSVTNAMRKYVGEYIPADNAYNFYPTVSIEGQSATGVVRSNVRLVLRASSSNLAVAETFALVEGKEVQMQSYRFTRN